ncbi:hypothetical protein I302_107508 [Kwoniella bestiolae CBS 10118]|uniref:Uncharacterized protein n=1 Tax=Kwoniella bestiolae CBS 10118 TaxID=1296100 RepID=A0A1B9FYB6_9TREE|nr:hypothetical protein I302_06751 [Kwoniella bestiolae CBS 10118]OCF23767.1 hypothetical protein I302_06751 [Kwoniella bestiolae CBS 10118]
MTKLVHALLPISIVLPTPALAAAPEKDAKGEIVAKVKLTIPKYSEWINSDDQNDYKRGEDQVNYGFTQKDIDDEKKYQFVWSTLEHIDDVPKTFFPTPYWNITCEVGAGQAFDGAASFTLSEKEPWIKVNEAKPWTGVSCKEPKCLAEACKDEAAPVIDTFLP